MASIIPINLVESIVLENWNLIGDFKPLDGFEDINFCLETNQQQKFLVKIYLGSFSDQLDFQIKALKHIEQKQTDAEIEFPSIVPTIHKADYVSVENDGKTYIFRVHTWVSGKLWKDCAPKSSKLLHNLGEKAGILLNLFHGFRHNAEKRKDFEWDLANGLWIEAYLNRIDENLQSIIHKIVSRYQSDLPIYNTLYKSVIHNDLNDHNILVNDSKVSGFIDLGDMCYTQRINDLAILLAYAMMEKADPLDAACDILDGYSHYVDLDDSELYCLFNLICFRLCVSITKAAINIQENPENLYLQISYQTAVSLLKQLDGISDKFALLKFRKACRKVVFPNAEEFKNWLNENSGKWSKVCPLEINSNDYFVLDLGIGSTQLGHEHTFNDAHKHEASVKRLLSIEKKSFAIGKYNEVRPLYSSDDFTTIGNNGRRWRTVHIGLDFFHDSDTEVYAFYQGIVHAIHYNSGNKNYGYTVILKHQMGDSFFFTLYGHLSGKVLSHLKLGQTVQTGETIAWFGNPSENGNWAPHLHFQIILDLLNFENDFPGVCYVHEREIYTTICPNPSELFGIIETPYPQMDANEILSKRKKILGRSYSISYDNHIHVQRAANQYLYDHKGRKYLDCVNNVPHVGHQNIRVLEAAQRQMNLLNTNTRYLHENIIKLAEKLTSTLPDSLSVCHFVNSGSEANELAIRMSRTYTGRQDIVAMEHGYHGNTNLCVDMSSYKFNGKGGFGQKDYVHLLEMPEPFRGKYKGDRISEAYSQDAINHIHQIIKKRGQPAAFICESILSCGGQLCFPDNYLKSIYSEFRKMGMVMIADEVQVGLGRVGNHMWAFENEGVIPDILTIGKPFGNGHPIGAVVCTKEIADAFANGMEYFNTFGGNPVSCAIGLEVLNIVEEENLMANALTLGNYVKEGFRNLQSQHAIIGDVRGHGFFLGWEFINDENWTPAAKQAAYFANRIKEMGILLSTDGPLHNVIKFKPPMIFTKENADYLLECAAIIMKEDLMQPD